MSRQVITAFEYADIFGYHISSVWRKLRDGTIQVQPLPRKPGSQLLFSKADVEAFLGTTIDTDALDFGKLPVVPDDVLTDESPEQ